MIIIIADNQDLHADAVISKIQDKSFIRLNPHGVDCILSFDSSDYSIFKINDLEINLTEITGIYCRVALDQSPPEISDPVENFATSEYFKLISNLFGYISKELWINHPWTESLIDNKFSSLITASKIGINVPRFFGSNDKSFIEEKISNPSENFVIKPISDASIAFQNGKYVKVPGFDDFSAPYTTDLKKTLISKTAQNFTPTLIQLKIESNFEYRVAVIDNVIFSTKLIKDKSIIDSRLQNSRIEVVEKPNLATCDLLIQLTSLLGLRFCTFDLLEDANKKFWLVDINPTGNWLWQETKLNLTISTSIANALS